MKVPPAIRLASLLALLAFSSAICRAESFEDSFKLATEKYRAGEYPAAAAAFRDSARQQLASGTLQNLGNAEWLSGRNGAAVLAWEQALWINPLDQAARQDLRYGRKNAQLESPELAWYEVVSTWLPANCWAWIATASFWLGIAFAVLPGILRFRKRVWHQAFAAVAFMIFLLSLPAYAGVHSRSHLGFILQKDVNLRLTPTTDAQVVTHLAPGDPARLVRKHGDFLLIRTNRSLGWVRPAEFGLISDPLPPS